MTDNAGDVTFGEDVYAAVERALAAGDFASHRSPRKTARYVLEALRALPVERRMEAMGMDRLWDGEEWVYVEAEAGT